MWHALLLAGQVLPHSNNPKAAHTTAMSAALGIEEWCEWAMKPQTQQAATQIGLGGAMWPHNKRTCMAPPHARRCAPLLHDVLGS